MVTAKTNGRSDRLVFGLNGEIVEIENPDPRLLLVDYLRSPEVGLTGTKLVCGAAGCGACTVMLSRYHPERDHISHVAINSCVRPLCALDGMHITTIEAVGSTRNGLSPLQHQLVVLNGSQCGYCTPGFVMNMHALLVNDPKPTSQKIEDAFGGNICRCTGYRPIFQAMKSFAVDYDPHSYRTNHPIEIDESEITVREQETPPKFPDALLEYAKSHRSLQFQANGRRWYRPADLAEAQQLKREHAAEGPKLVTANTAFALIKDDPAVSIGLEHLPELAGITSDDHGIHPAGGTSLFELMTYIDEHAPALPPEKALGLKAMWKHVELIAHVQVRSVGSMAGNIMLARAQADTAEPFPSDLDILLHMLGATVTLSSQDYEGGSRDVTMEDLPAPADQPRDLILTAFHIPYTRQGDHIRTFKIMPRPQAAHAVINAGFRVNLDPHGTVRDSTLVLGGVAGHTIRASRTEAFLEGRSWDEETLHGSIKVLSEEVAENLRPLGDTQFLPENYRQDLAENLFYAFYIAVAHDRHPHSLGSEIQSGAVPHERPLSGGTQHLEVAPDEAPIGDPILNPALFLQATGEAHYTQDLPLPPRGLHANVVLSECAHGTFSYRGGLEAVERELKQRFPSVETLVTVADVKGRNIQGLAVDEPVFADGEVLCWGQLIALVVGSDPMEIKAAARWVNEQIEYQERPAALTIEDALALPNGAGVFTNNEYGQHIPNIVRKDSDEAWLQDPKPVDGGKLVTGVQRSPGQAHFYMETQATLAFPDELGSMQIYSSTQNPTNDQGLAASLLGIPINDVQVTVRRIGGGYGGKQVRGSFISGPAAVAAWKTNRPVRLVLDRAEDMKTIGKRNPSRAEYSVAVSQDGMLQGMKIDMMMNGGISRDQSFPVLDLCQQHLDGAYYIPTMATTGDVARTNIASNTGFRSFGVVQATLAIEEVIEHAAHEIGMLPEELRHKNLYANGTPHHHQWTHYGQALSHCIIREMWDRMWRTSSFMHRYEAITEFNRKNRWVKRGICMIPNKYGIGYQPRLLDQGGALVSAYAQDGSVLLQHGGIEMGQGLHMKMIQIAAETLGIPVNRIRVGDTWTGTVPNSSPTAASTGADLNGGAVKAACLELRRRLEKAARDNNIEGWEQHWADRWTEIVAAGYADRVDLLVEGHYKEPYIENIDSEHQYGHVFLYFCYAVGCSEVEINVLTGETTLLRSDVLFDAGQSLNPAIDIGQVEGGFMQGVGMMLTEDVLFEENGKPFTVGTWTYKLPVSHNVPIDFRVALNPSPKHHGKHGTPLDPAAIQSSKGVGEPALVLASSAFFAIKRAILAARRDHGETGWFELTPPATIGDIQQACRVDKAARVLA